MGKTTGWTKEDVFHPADIASAIIGFTLKPNTAIGLTELVTYVLGEGRNSHADNEGRIMGFYFNVAMIRLPAALPEIKKQFPEIDKFLSSFDKKTLCHKLSNENFHLNFIAKLEEKFGSEVVVKKMEMPEERLSERKISPKM